MTKLRWERTCLRNSVSRRALECEDNGIPKQLDEEQMTRGLSGEVVTSTSDAGPFLISQQRCKAGGSMTTSSLEWLAAPPPHG